jgi:hypothetical protein
VEAGAKRLEQRGPFDVHGGGNEVRVCDWRDRELCESAGERGGRGAKMEAAGAARTASPAMAERIERDSIADFEICDVRTDLDDFARGFVAENDGEARDHPLRTELPIDDVQVGAAYAARADTNEQGRVGGGGHGGFDQLGAGRGTSLCDRFDLGNL